MHNWKNIIIAPSETIKTAMEVLEKEAMRIVLVAEKDCVLLGTLTDGDIRRAILHDISLEAPVFSIMNKSPKVISEYESRDAAVSIMQKYDLLCMPRVSQNNKLIDLETLHGFKPPHSVDNTVFIMAGGFGSRLYPLTKFCPKPMLDLSGKPVLERIMDNFIKAGFWNFVVSTHFLPEVIKDYFGDGGKFGVKIRYVHEDQPLGTGGALNLIPDDAKKFPLVMMNGDIITSLDMADLLNCHNKNGSSATMVVRNFEHQVPYGVVKTCEGDIVAIEEKPVQNHLINSGIYVLSPQFFDTLSPGYADMPDLILSAIEQSHPVKAYLIKDKWIDIGVPVELERARNIYNK